MNIFKAAAVKIYEQARREKRLIEGCTLAEIKRLAVRQDGVIQTQMGSVAADSEPMNRSAPHTRNSIDHPFGEPEERLAAQARADRRLVFRAVQRCTRPAPNHV